MHKQQLISELEKVRDANGLIKAEAVVEAAKPKTHPLHNQFEWDDKIAGPAYRITQARQLIRVAVMMLDNPDIMEPIRAFVSLVDDRSNKEGGGYRALVSVMDDLAQRKALLRQALRELKGFERKYAQLVELIPIFEAVKALDLGERIPT